MKCQNCGSPIPDGKLFCPKCGSEVRLVDDYDPIGLLGEKGRKPPDGDGDIKKGGGAGGVLIRILFASVIAALLSAAAIFAMTGNSGKNLPYVRARLEKYLEEEKYDRAFSCCEKAIRLDPASDELQVQKADILLRQGRTDDALSCLREAHEVMGSSPVVLEKLISICIEEEDHAAVAELLRNTEDQELRERYGQYAVTAPAMSLISGRAYPYGTRLTISTEAGSIYYTFDGSIPDSSGPLYTKPLKLHVGVNRISAVSIGSFGIRSPVVSGVYTVKARETKASVISRPREEAQEEDGYYDDYEDSEWSEDDEEENGFDEDADSSSEEPSGEDDGGNGGSSNGGDEGEDENDEEGGDGSGDDGDGDAPDGDLGDDGEDGEGQEPSANPGDEGGDGQEPSVSPEDEDGDVIPDDIIIDIYDDEIDWDDAIAE